MIKIKIVILFISEPAIANRQLKRRNILFTVRVGRVNLNLDFPFFPLLFLILFFHYFFVLSSLFFHHFDHYFSLFLRVVKAVEQREIAEKKVLRGRITELEGELKAEQLSRGMITVGTESDPMVIQDGETLNVLII